MNDLDKKHFREIMIGTGEVYGKDVTSVLLRMYFNELAEYDLVTVAKAFSAHLRSTDQYKRHFPTPGEIIQLIEGTDKDKQQAISDRAEIAWQCIEAAIKRVGRYGTLALDDKQALACVKALGGWQHLCNSTTDQLVWIKKEFINSYATYERVPVESLPQSLPGIHELNQHKREGAKAIGDLIKKIDEQAN